MGYFSKILKSPVALANQILRCLGFKIVRDVPLVYLHKYSTYEEYSAIQKFHNRRKLQNVWADDFTLQLATEAILANTLNAQSLNSIRGLCHGARNGYEVLKLRALIGSQNIIGTDISDTAVQFDCLRVWDFHEENPEWIGAFDFVYTNSLDQSWKPFDALECWLRQIKSSGLLIIEHTRAHGVEEASSMDPFGVLPEYFPYVVCEHFGRSVSLEIITSVKSNNKIDVWLFLLRKANIAVNSLD